VVDFSFEGLAGEERLEIGFVRADEEPFKHCKDGKAIAGVA